MPSQHAIGLSLLIQPGLPPPAPPGLLLQLNSPLPPPPPTPSSLSLQFILPLPPPPSLFPDDDFEMGYQGWGDDDIVGMGELFGAADKGKCKVCVSSPRGRNLPSSHSSSNPLTRLHQQMMLILPERGSKSVMARRRQSCKTMPTLPPPPISLFLYLPLRPQPPPPLICTLLYINPHLPRAPRTTH